MKGFFLSLCVFVFFSQLAVAADNEEKPLEISKTMKRDREGFFLGFGLGPGKLFSDEVEDFGDNAEGFLIDLRIGAGLSEDFLLFGEVTGLTIPQDNVCVFIRM